jgi:23S rRNA (cytosine1962-C5)-methyltransferase
MIDGSFFGKRIREAINRRSFIDAGETNAYRVVHGENDSLPGLILDRYDSYVVIKLYTASWLPHLESLLETILESFHPTAIVVRLSRTLLRNEGILYGLKDGTTLLGEKVEKPVQFIENNLKFEADIINGHKTGFYLDQRENRARLEKIIASDIDLRTVLNVFAYSGAFSLYSARGGATRITNIDISKAALETARICVRLNDDHPNIHSAQQEFIVEDAFKAMDRLIAEGRFFDVTIIDPPSFAVRRSQIGKAIKAYGLLVRKALRVTRSGGLVAQFSCSGQIDPATFYNRVNIEAHNMGRSLKEIARSGHPADHPIEFAQGRYLKGLFAYAI